MVSSAGGVKKVEYQSLVSPFRKDIAALALLSHRHAHSLSRCLLRLLLVSVPTFLAMWFGSG
jgi:hypothetical protein